MQALIHIGTVACHLLKKELRIDVEVLGRGRYDFASFGSRKSPPGSRVDVTYHEFIFQERLLLNGKSRACQPPWA